MALSGLAGRLALLGLVSCRAHPDAGLDGGSPPRNVLVVLLDDVSPWQVGTYGLHDRAAVTPTLGRLAAEGLMFTNFYAMPSCSPTRAALLTGRYGRRYHIGRWMFTTLDWELPLEEVTIAEQLSRGADPYVSHAVGKWHVSTFASNSGLSHPLKQGFATYRGLPPNLDLYGDYFHFPKVTAAGTFELRHAYATTDEVDDAIEVIAHSEGPFFVYLAIHGPHTPFHVAPEELRTVEITEESAFPYQVIGAIEAVDAELGRLLASIDPEVLANTDVFVLSDNGAPNNVSIPPIAFADGKGSLYEGGVNVPMIAWGPDVAAPGTVTAALGHVVDLFPTIAEIAEVPVDHEIDGVSLLPLLRGEVDTSREFVYVEAFFPNGPVDELKTDERAVRDADWKLIRNLNRPDELYRMDQPVVDGRDILASPLEAESRRAYQRLSAELDRVEVALGLIADAEK